MIKVISAEDFKEGGVCAAERLTYSRAAVIRGPVMGGSLVRRLRVALAALGGVLVIIALFRDSLPIGVPDPGFGKNQLAVLCAGVATIVLAGLVRDSAFAGWVIRPLLVGASVYFALVLCELGLLARAAPDRKPAHSLGGLYCQDNAAGYKLAPNFHGYYDDGVVVAQYDTNSRGDRDDEPRSSDGRRLLLIGDSFTFGARLDQQERIDVQIERHSDGRLDAYNLGVPGYGPAAILEHFRACEWFNGTDVVYLFFNNDLTNPNLAPGYWTCFDGFIVPRCKPDGTPFGEEEYRARIKRAQSASAMTRTLTLSRVRVFGDAAWKLVWNPESRLLDDNDPSQYGPENVDAAVRYTQAMRSLSAARGMRFHVVIVPSLGEVAERRYAAIVSDYIGRLRSQGVPVIELLDRLCLDDYFREEGHFNGSGARRTAAAIVESAVGG